MLASDKSKTTSKMWTILYIATTILKAHQASSGKIDTATDQIMEATMIEVSKSLLQLNDGQWD